MKMTSIMKPELTGISYDRMCEIATKAINKIFDDDPDDAAEFLMNEVEAEPRELDFFGITWEEMEDLV